MNFVSVPSIKAKDKKFQKNSAKSHLKTKIRPSHKTKARSSCKKIRLGPHRDVSVGGRPGGLAGGVVVVRLPGARIHRTVPLVRRRGRRFLRRHCLRNRPGGLPLSIVIIRLPRIGIHRPGPSVRRRRRRLHRPLHRRLLPGRPVDRPPPQLPPLRGGLHLQQLAEPVAALVLVLPLLRLVLLVLPRDHGAHVLEDGVYVLLVAHKQRGEGKAKGAGEEGGRGEG
mmetsp:Transcript_11937/g.26172  ORF Transcript_11937/g.26172 Transcript_11937/m.26172 type:complete len:225 (+) Transcript_11937:651-1325(+)